MDCNEYIEALRDRNGWTDDDARVKHTTVGNVLKLARQAFETGQAYAEGRARRANNRPTDLSDILDNLH